MERSALSPRMTFFMKPRKGRRQEKYTQSGFQDVSLSFSTQRIQRAKAPEPVESILLNASHTQEMSYQKTVPIRTRFVNPELYQGYTLANRIGRMDYRKSQALILFSISSMGLLIGFLISCFL